MIYNSEVPPIIVIDDLPSNVKAKIPYSIKTYKPEYKLEELPFEIQYYIKQYYSTQQVLDYSDTILDIKTAISMYGDFETITNIYDLVCEYLKVYMCTHEGTYPFDPYFGTRLKEYVQTKDTALQYTLINSEINAIANKLSYDLDLMIAIVSINIETTSRDGIDSVYNIKIKLKINDNLKQLDLAMVT